MLLWVLPSRAADPSSCPGGVAVSTFRLMVAPRKGGPALPVTSMNLIEAGETLRYEPVRLPSAIKPKARVALLLVPSHAEPANHLQVLDAQPAKSAAEWKVPVRASVVGVVLGPQGLDVKKVSSLIQKNPQLISELADYAQRTSTVEALVQTLSQYEQSAPGSSDLNAALRGFSSQFGVAIPKLDPKAPSDQQAASLLQAVLPSLSSYDPLTSSRAMVVQQSTGLAASVAGLFFGTPVGLAAGGVALFQDLHMSLFPDTDFRSAFTQPAGGDGLALCAKNQTPKSRNRIAYLWMLRVPDTEPPSISLAGTADLPIGWISSLKVTCSKVAELKLLPRLRDWQLVSAGHEATVPVKVTVGSQVDLLKLDLQDAKLPPGEYHLAAKWDWKPLEVKGTVNLHPFADFSKVKLTPDSQDRLIAGSSAVPVELAGADFEFVNKVALLEAGNTKAAPRDLSFTLSRAPKAGEADRLITEVDTTSLRPGSYRLALSQLNGKAQDVALTVHPPNPTLEGLPLRVNVGEPEQKIRLRGTGLERITRITGPGAEWELSPAPPDAHNLTERQAAMKLAAKARKGETLAASLYVSGIDKPLSIPDVLQVAGPRPKILSVNKSFAAATDVELRPGEIPAGLPLSFAIRTEHTDSRPSLALACSNGSDTRQKITLLPGDKDSSAELDSAGEGLLFLSLDPGTVGQSGCHLTATVTVPATGNSDPFPLGGIVRLPRIDKFTVEDKGLGNSLYAGSLTGYDLQTIEKTGWNATVGLPVQGIPTPIPGNPKEQTLQIAMPWPPPTPQAPLYVWLRGESEGRLSKARY